MRALLQRVSHASVTVEKQIIGAIDQGLLIFLGVGHEDSESQIQPLVEKIVHLRIFPDENDKMNLSLLDITGEILVISQFTLHADARKGRRPNFIKAAAPSVAEPLYEQFKAAFATYGLHMASGIFGASMSVALQNEGPVTIWLDTDDL